jgi:hypothetical protein
MVAYVTFLKGRGRPQGKPFLHFKNGDDDDDDDDVDDDA